MIEALLSTKKANKLYVDDVFITYLYTGNGSTQTINNGIDLAGEGGLVWGKARSLAYDHQLHDTFRGAVNFLMSNSAAAQVTDNPHVLTSFNSNGFTVGSSGRLNDVSQSFASWTFRRAKKFFDIVTYTGNGVAGRQIPHELGVEPGMIVVKQTSGTGAWKVWHRSLPVGNLLELNATAAQQAQGYFPSQPTDSGFFVSATPGSATNASGQSYVAYLFAHDDTEDGIIQCGSFTTDASARATVDLGWEPQFVIQKTINQTNNWWMTDSMRGATTDGGQMRQLLADRADAEMGGTIGAHPTATGFVTTGIAASQPFIYLAIRRPNKPPTSGTEVFMPIRDLSGSSPSTVQAGFVVDMALRVRNIVGAHTGFDRLRGGLNFLETYTPNNELQASNTRSYFDIQAGVRFDGAAVSGSDVYTSQLFRRAPGFHDQICYTGTGANKTEAHNLTKAPELWLAKRRDATGSWVWGSTLLNANEKIIMPSPNGRVTDATAWNSTYPTDANISLGTLADVNASGGTYTLYMWATLAGISKVGTYTGNGSSQTIDCGFTTGARFIMIIRMTASTAQDIYLWDSARGITSGNDPRLSLNTNAAEVTTDDSVDPAPEGFGVNQVAATNINVSGANYIFLAVA